MDWEEGRDEEEEAGPDELDAEIVLGGGFLNSLLHDVTWVG